jgi:hypothetical protein
LSSWRLPIFGTLVFGELGEFLACEQVGAADEIVEPAEAERSHELADLLRHAVEEGDEVSRACPGT